MNTFFPITPSPEHARHILMVKLPVLSNLSESIGTVIILMPKALLLGIHEGGGIQHSEPRCPGAARSPHHQEPSPGSIHPRPLSRRSVGEVEQHGGLRALSWTMSSSSVDRIALSTSLKIRLFPAAAWMLRRAEVGRLARLSNNHPNTSAGRTSSSPSSYRSQTLSSESSSSDSPFSLLARQLERGSAPSSRSGKSSSISGEASSRRPDLSSEESWPQHEALGGFARSPGWASKPFSRPTTRRRGGRRRFCHCTQLYALLLNSSSMQSNLHPLVSLTDLRSPTAHRSSWAPAKFDHQVFETTPYIRDWGSSQPFSEQLQEINCSVTSC